MGCFGVGYSIMRIAMVQYLNGFSPKVGSTFGGDALLSGGAIRFCIAYPLGFNERIKEATARY